MKGMWQGETSPIADSAQASLPVRTAAFSATSERTPALNRDIQADARREASLKNTLDADTWVPA